MRKIIVICVILLYALLMFGFIFFTFQSGFAMELFSITNAQRVRAADMMKFLTICLSFLTALIFLRDAFDRYDGSMLVIAMALTVVTDVFLVLIARQPGSHVRGMVLYCIVMCVYFARYNYKRPKNALMLPFFLVIPVTLHFLSQIEGFLLYGDRQRELIIVVTFYIQVFLAVIVSLIKRVREGRYPKPNAVLLLMSLGFFIVSDIIVVLSNWDVFAITNLRRVIFIVYTPSQALLAFSAYNFYRKNARIG